MTAHTLHFGTNYAGTMNELSGCLNDARDVLALCKPKVKTTTQRIRSRYDRDGAIASFRTARHRLEKPGDILFVSISGHGTRERVGDRYVEALVCDDLELIYDYEWAAECADRAPGTFILGLLDTCHSATLHRGFPRVRKRSIPIGRCNTHAHPKSTKPRALTNCGFIAGCEEDSYSYDGVFDGRPNGALTYYTLQTIKQLKRGATFNDLYRGICRELPSDEYPQSPQRMGSTKNFRRAIPFL